MTAKNLLRKPKYFNPTSDYGFKKLFGEEVNKDLLMDFLNSMLPEWHQIADLTFQNVELQGDDEDLRRTVFDIYCTSTSGEKFIVEMQKSGQSYFLDRALFYSATGIVRQGEKGKDWRYKLKTVYFFGILNFEYDQNKVYWKKRQLLRRFELTDKNGVQMSDKLQFMLLQLPFFKKKPHQLETRFDKWCYFLKHLENLNHIPHILNEPVFMKAFDAATIEKMEPLEYIAYQKRLNAEMDYELVIEYAEEKALAKGLKKGIEQGIEQGIEHNLKLGFLSIEDIALVFNVPFQLVLDIKERLKL